MNQQPDITILPDDLWFHVLHIGIGNSCLNYQDLCRLSLSCRLLKRFSDDNSIWFQLLSSDYPSTDNDESCSSSSFKSLYQIRRGEAMDMKIKMKQLESDFRIRMMTAFDQLRGMAAALQLQ